MIDWFVHDTYDLAYDSRKFPGRGRGNTHAYIHVQLVMAALYIFNSAMFLYSFTLLVSV